jgi:hypothetical protein
MIKTCALRTAATHLPDNVSSKTSPVMMKTFVLLTVACPLEAVSMLPSFVHLLIPALLPLAALPMAPAFMTRAHALVAKTKTAPLSICARLDGVPLELAFTTTSPVMMEAFVQLTTVKVEPASMNLLCAMIARSTF